MRRRPCVQPGDVLDVDDSATCIIAIGSDEHEHRTDIQHAAAVDPITVEIIRNGLLAVTEEMKTNLMRTAYNLIIYEALDFTVGLFTSEGETISIGLGLPMFIRGMSETVKAKIRHYRARRTSSPATSSSPTTPTPPAAISTTSPSRCRSSTRAS